MFREEGLDMRHKRAETSGLPYNDVIAIEIGGAGETRTGGGFFGGGFGVQGAAEGMLAATALNMLTSRTKVDTVISIRAQNAELFFHNNRVPPEELRMQMSPVFTRLRGRTQASSKQTQVTR